MAFIARYVGDGVNRAVKAGTDATTAISAAAGKAAAEKVDNPLVAAVKFDKSRLTQWGRKPAGVDALDFARQRVVAVGGQPPADADAATLKRLFGELTRTAAATSTELPATIGTNVHH